MTKVDTNRIRSAASSLACLRYDSLAQTMREAADEIERLRTALRVNVLRLAPDTPHDEIDAVIDAS